MPTKKRVRSGPMFHRSGGRRGPRRDPGRDGQSRFPGSRRARAEVSTLRTATMARWTGDTSCMVDDTARDRAIYHALKAVDEVAAALQTHLIEEHGADPERAAPQGPATNSLKLLRQARERLGLGLRAVEADHIAGSDEISLRRSAPA